MEILGYGVRTHKVRRPLGAMTGALILVAAHTAFAQTNPAGSATEQAPSEAARRAALSPFRFILQNATAPARKPQAAPAKPAEAPAVAEPKRSAPAPVQQAAVQPSPASRVPAQPASDVTLPASAPAPEPAIAALSRPPVEPPPPRRHEVIPIRTDQPRLPPSLMRDPPSGRVKVEFEIQTDGSVASAKVLSSTNRALNRPTLDAVQGWKFEPVDDVLTIETEVVYKPDL